MFKDELIEKISRKTGQPLKATGETIGAFVEVVTEALAEGKPVKLLGFGTFEVRERAATHGVNPQTHEKIEIPARKVVGFKAGTQLKAAVK